MRIDIKRKEFFVVVFLLQILSITAQYTVVGGAKEPLLAVDNSNYRIKVYLVYGLENVNISYTSSSTNHKWYRYKTKVDDLSPEPVASIQNGTASTIVNVEDGYGYYVDENGAMRHYVWIIDYSKYVFDIRSLNVSSEADPCSAIRLSGDADMDEMVYYVPSGLPFAVKREFEISYETLLWNESLLRFDDEHFTKTIDSNPFATSFPAPLTDTEITLSGDLFARYFGAEKTISTPFYQAKAIEVHADTTVVGAGSQHSDSENVLPVPAEVRFRAIANTPVAALFNWKIYKDEDLDNPLINFNSEELVYTFNREGIYTAVLEVSDRTGVCYNDQNTFQIVVNKTIMEIPNAFSPGITPGINDVFRVKCESVVKFQGWIFNRWGNQLFHWSNPSQGWDGKYNGKYVSAGAYYYVIEYTGTDGKNHVRKGDVNVFRGRAIDMEEKNNEGM
jgi:gliding motility-associated-like protein